MCIIFWKYFHYTTQRLDKMEEAEEQEMRNIQGGFKLPPDISFRKEFLSGTWAYVFRHKELGVAPFNH